MPKALQPDDDKKSPRCAEPLMDREEPIDTGSGVEGTDPGHDKPKTNRKNPRRAKLVTERPLPSSALSETNDA